MIFHTCREFGYFAAHLMNAVILSSVLSPEFLDVVASAHAHAMAHSRKAPPLFLRSMGRGVRSRRSWRRAGQRDRLFYQPGGRSEDSTDFLQRLGPERFHHLGWASAICHLRFRRAWIAQGRSLK